ncbi:MAG TPA: PKD domain-containing protein [Tepidisphaeraceae bacterium]|nr:PKD domain-containing protein [Tepidisphaeraceae bacterium]
MWAAQFQSIESLESRLFFSTNLLPIADPGGPYSVKVNDVVQLDGSKSSDPDGSIVSYEWDLAYNGTTFDVDATGAETTFDASGWEPQTMTIALRVTDNLGASEVTTALLTIQPGDPTPPPPDPTPTPLPPAPPSSDLFQLIDDPSNPGKQILTVNGTAHGDFMQFRSNHNGQIVARMNGKTLGTFSNISMIMANGNDGNDFIDARCANVPVEFFGGKGNDILIGGKLGDVLVGGDGNDWLFGEGGVDLLVGGMGRDRLDGGAGDDLLVGDALTNQDDPSAMQSLLKSQTLDSGTVIDDQANDILHDGHGHDHMCEGHIRTIKMCLPHIVVITKHK